MPESVAPVGGDIFPTSDSPAAAQPGMTWDELRKLNRECFERAAAAEVREILPLPR